MPPPQTSRSNCRPASKEKSRFTDPSSLVPHLQRLLRNIADQYVHSQLQRLVYFLVAIAGVDSDTFVMTAQQLDHGLIKGCDGQAESVKERLRGQDTLRILYRLIGFKVVNQRNLRPALVSIDQAAKIERGNHDGIAGCRSDHSHGFPHFYLMPVECLPFAILDLDQQSAVVPVCLQERLQCHDPLILVSCVRFRVDQKIPGKVEGLQLGVIEIVDVLAGHAEFIQEAVVPEHGNLIAGKLNVCLDAVDRIFQRLVESTSGVFSTLSVCATVRVYQAFPGTICFFYLHILSMRGTNLLIRPANSIAVIPALRRAQDKLTYSQAGIQWRARRADTCFCWIPGQVRNDEVHSVCLPNQYGSGQGKSSMNLFIDTLSAGKFGLYIKRRSMPAFRFFSVSSPCRIIWGLLLQAAYFSISSG